MERPLPNFQREGEMLNLYRMKQPQRELTPYQQSLVNQVIEAAQKEPGFHFIKVPYHWTYSAVQSSGMVRWVVRDTAGQRVASGRLPILAPAEVS
jgi:hypothetical protein